MSTVTAYRFLEELCLTVQFDLDRFAIDASWIAGASVGGLFIGGVITAIIIICCGKQMVKKKQQDEETATVFCRGVITAIYLEDGDATCLPSLRCLGKTGSLSKDDKRGPAKKKGSLSTDEKDEKQMIGTKVVKVETRKQEVVNIKDKETYSSSGMINILMKTNDDHIDKEMKKQDLDAVNKMEQDQEKLRNNMEIKLLKMHLKKLYGKGRVSEPYLADIVQKVTDQKKKSQEVLDLERAKNEEEIKKKYAKNEKELQEALESSETEYNHKLRLFHKDEQEHIRQILLSTSGLSETEVDDLMEEFKQNLAELERKRGLQQARQARVLAERLEKRRKILELQRLQKAQNQEALSEEVKAFHEPLDMLLSDGKIIERQKNELLDQYEKDVIAIKKNHEMTAMRQQQDLAEKLKQRREQKMKELAEKHEQEQFEHLNKIEEEVNMEEFIESYPDLVNQQQLELEKLQTKLDDTEVQQMEEVKMELDKQKDTEIKERRKKLEQAVKSYGQLPESDINGIIKLHEIRMNDLENRQKDERDRMIARLKDKLEKRMLEVDQEAQEDSTNKDTIQKQQENVINELLSDIEDLTEEARDKILLEHKRNMEKLNNELQRSKMKQELSLEHKLSERRRQLAELQRQKEHAELEKKAMTDKEIKDLENQLAAEEKRYEEERQRALSDLRQKLAEETKAALEAQTDGLAALIGHLKTGHARRQAIIKRNDEILKKLKKRRDKDQSEQMMREPTYADTLIQQHNKQMQDVKDNIEHKREQQDQMLIEKIERKKRELEDQKCKEKMERQNARVSKASQILHQIFLERKYKKAKDELEQEMKIESERHRDQLNWELEEQRRKILSHLATAIKTA